jgi:hypothetical protein
MPTPEDRERLRVVKRLHSAPARGVGTMEERAGSAILSCVNTVETTFQLPTSLVALGARSVFAK